MKKLFVFIFSTISFFSFVPSSFAATTTTLCAKNGYFAPLCNPSLDKLILGLINLIFILSVVVALLYLIWGGFKWLTSGGDKTAVQGAREHIVAAIVGLVIIFMSYFILNFIVQFFLPGFSLREFTLPNIENTTGEKAEAKCTPKCESGKICSNGVCIKNDRRGNGTNNI